MRKNRVLISIVSMLVVVAACSSSGSSASPSAAEATTAPPSVAPASVAPASSAPAAALPTIKIGSDNFPESATMGEIYAQVLEHAGYTVERKFNVGSRQDRIPTMDAGQIDLVPEYVGSGLGFYDKTKITGDGAANAAALQAAVTAKGLTVLGITPAQDTNAFVVRKETADSMNLAKMSDLAAVQDKIKWGLPADCDTNPICSGALKTYGITYPPKDRQALGACSVPMAEALNGKAIDLAELCSTQSAIAQFGFVSLVDDLATQPAENIAPLVRDDFLAKTDKAAFEALLNAASAKITTEELTKLGVAVEVDHKDPGDVVKQWLTDNGLLQ
jgi:osmoprotectant transport system substrate-binding protein